MRSISTLMIVAGLVFVPMAAAQAAPAAVAAAVAAKDRPAAARAMDASRKPVEVLTFLGLERGDRALDLLTTTGYYAEIMGRAVGPTGIVIGHQPASFWPDEAREAWATLPTRVPNVHLMKTAGRLEMPPNSYDFVMMHLNYHDLYGPGSPEPTLAARLFGGVKPGGIVAIVDHVAAAGSNPHDTGNSIHRIDPAAVRKDFEAAGFTLEAESDVLRNPDDDHTRTTIEPPMQGKTDRFVYKFRKPA